jgi:beta-glucosidase
VKLTFNAGTDLDAAATAAQQAEVAIVFVSRWETEGDDSKTMSLPDNQDDLIAKVAAANPHTIVVLETGNPITMPWVDKVSGVLEAWFAGSRGSDALANILFGDVTLVEIAHHLPWSEADLPHQTIVQPPPGTYPPQNPNSWKQALEGYPVFQTAYDESLKIGYKWYDAEKKQPQFPFGYGLSYTTYSYSNMKVTPGEHVRVSFTVKNTGSRAGAEIAQVYASFPSSAGEPPKRLVGWSRVKLNPGESKM